MATILKGAPVAAALNRETAARCEALARAGCLPTLAVVRLGEREDDLSYEAGVRRRCQQLGIVLRSHVLSRDVDPSMLLELIGVLNDDPSIHGCLLLRPLPAGQDEAAVCAALAPAKDVDGITAASLAGVFAHTGVGYAPCTAQACLEILHHYDIPLTGRRVAVVGRSLVVGKPVAMLLEGEHATITLCHSRTRDLPEVCREADIVVAALGRRGAIGAAHLRPGQVVLDVGIHVGEDGGLCGDVDFAAAEPLVSAITPVPGGVGAVTTAVLMRHVVEAAERARG